ncbi:amino acid adenylation domain-containing protein [Nonomuraea sp. NPDC049758]|uniref:non-ribosomal peptide synthetase n=1 Tax=Nonomuraea sp. NPDC049758 TaxID=3154360 RepID=UPI003418FBAC
MSLSRPAPDAVDLDYWTRALNGLAALELPTDFPRPATPSYREAAVAFAVNPDVAAGLRRHSAHGDATLAITLNAAFCALLSRLTGQTDVAVGWLFAGDADPAGARANTLVLRTDLRGDPAFSEVTARVREVTIAGLDHRDPPLERLVDELRPNRIPGRHPLIQTAFRLSDYAPLNTGDVGPGSGPGGDGAVPSSGASLEPDMALDLWLDIADEPGGQLSGRVVYDAALFGADTVRAFAARFLRVLDAVAADPGTRLSELPVLDVSERHRLLTAFVPPAVEVEPLCAHELFEREVRRRPDAVALVCGEVSLTFRELNADANRLARALRARGVGPDTRVALCAGREAGTVVAILAVWKAGGAYVPLDPAHPVERWRLLLADVEPALLLARSGQLARLDSDVPALALDEPWGERDGHNLGLPSDPSRLAYLIHTSGSTGTPKGVLVEHRNIVNLVTVMRPEFRIEAAGPDAPARRAAHTASFGFDASIDQLSWMIYGGHELHLVPDEVRRDTHELAAYVRDRRIDILNVTPSQLELLLSLGLFDGRSPAPGLVMVGGEAADRSLWSAMRRVPGTRFVNLYGPTECTVDATVCHVDGTDEPSIGRPVGNAYAYVVDHAGKLAPIGVEGEIWIGGAGVARGYWNRPELTARRFVADPFRTGRVVYRTGDLGRWRADGTLEFRGRLDDQLKIRGFRVEPGEVAATLTRHPGVRESAVVGHAAPQGQTALVAYVVADSGVGGRAEREQVDKWHSIFQETNAERARVDPTFDISGWISSFTGLPLSAEEMREWLRNTVGRVRELRPRRVLEIGVGTGLLLWNLAPDCERYVGTDFSASVLATLGARLRERPIDGVTLLHREADEFDDFAPGDFDCVLINSVAQYFPSADYFRNVLSGALKVLQPGGHVFAGDVRDLTLLDAYHYDVARARVGDASPEALRAEFQRQRQRENELVLSPGWFERFARDHSLGGVAVAPKAGTYDNELTRYRYDVVLSAAAPARPPVVTGWRDCSLEPITLSEAAASLTHEGRLLLSRVPNRLVRASALSAAHLTATIGASTSQADATDGTVDGAGGADGGAAAGAVSVAEFAALAAECGLPVVFSRLQGHTEGAFDIAIGEFAYRDMFPPPVTPPGDRATANTPTSARASDLLVHELREYLSDRLPDHLVPRTILLVPAIPLTVSGKLDVAALPSPGVPDAADTLGPRTEAERLLASVWAEVLNVPGAGVRDNFFDLGGNSLMATLVIARAAEAGLRLSLRDLFQNQTIEELAELCTTRTRGKDS